MAAKKDYLFDPTRNPLFRDDYRPSEYRIPNVNLRISLDAEKTIVHNFIEVEPNPAAASQGGALVLDGENLKLKSLQISDNGKLRHMDASEYLVTPTKLIIKNPPAGHFGLEIVTEINPEANTSLSGIYTDGDVICSQCEAQGFRRISYFLDRPDNLATFTVSLSADKEKYPMLLSNGNGDYKKPVDLGDGRHVVTWTDPFPKPSYLFAVVAGDMKVMEDTFTTMSGRKVDLRIFVQDGYEDKIAWAMQSVKRAMRWDEVRYGREYDLDCFHIVGVDKFNAGAMENKGLNVFNVSRLVGDGLSSTDEELIDIEAVIAHEYFHNWTGDRVTLRDWFELTLKEGLTVLRDRQFTEDTHSFNIKRIEDATVLKTSQFLEDSGPTSHPIRPDRVEEFDNIYTGTIYEKGSHVLGMLHTMMGEATWRAAMDEYFNRFDDKAVACDDFVDVMEEVSGIDLAQFRRWYSQSGTPQVSYDGVYDPAAKTYTLTLSQMTPPTADQAVKQPLHMPISVGLIGESGKDIPLTLNGDSTAPVTTKVLHLKDQTQTFVFTNVNGPVVPSVLRGFSAPVKIVTQQSDDDLIFRMSHDSDPYNKFEAAERMMVKTLRSLIEDVKNGKDLALPQAFIDAYRLNVDNALDGDLAFNARVLDMPIASLVTQGMTDIDPAAVETAMKFMRGTLAKAFKNEFALVYAHTTTPKNEKYDVVPAQVGRRDLRNTALTYLSRLDGPHAECVPKLQYDTATNMTEKLGGLGALCRMPQEKARAAAAVALDDFYSRYKDNNNLVCKWLRLKAGLPSENPVADVKALMQHPAFEETNPNKVFAVVGGFIAGNQTAYHAKDGSGYEFLADTILRMNDVNARTATRLSSFFAQFKMYSAERQDLMVKAMTRVMQSPTLDIGVKEIIGKALDTAKKPANDNAKATFGAAAKK